MVREIDATWNPLLESIELLFHKLVKLGFTYVDGEIIIVTPEGG
jgi:hypothetical protein